MLMSGVFLHQHDMELIAHQLIGCDAYSSLNKHNGSAASPIVNAFQHTNVFLTSADFVASFGREVPVALPGASY